MIENPHLAGSLYRACYVLGFVAIFVFNTIYAKKYTIKPLKALVFTVVSYVLIFMWSYILAWVMNGFQWGHHNAIRVYIWMPLVLLLTSKLFHVDFKKSLEFIVPSTCIVYGIARIGCIFPGCCYGHFAKWGMYSAQAMYHCFPVQLCEAITALLIAVLIIHLAKRKAYSFEVCDLYPLMLILYGGTRFLWEFAANNEKVIGNISELALWALATFIIGCVWLTVVLIKKRKRVTGKAKQ